MATSTQATRHFLPYGLVLLAVFTFGCNGQQTPVGGQKATNVYDRVMQSGEIRCAYAVYPPFSIKDPNSGELSGIFVDVIEMVAENLGLDVEWTEEVGFGEVIEGLETDRYDLMGTGVWANAARATRADFTIPICFSAIGVYVRSDDHRFDSNLNLINDPSTRIATVDGEISDLIAKSDFPNATMASLPQSANLSRLLLDVVENKADVTFVDPAFAALYLKEHPGSIRNITAAKPLKVFPDVYMVKRDQYAFKAMLDTALLELVNNGDVEKIIAKYEPLPGVIYRMRAPYAEPVQQ